MGISWDKLHKPRKTRGKRKPYQKNMNGDSPLPTPTLVPAAYTQPLCPRQQAPGLVAGREELPGLPALHTPDKIMDVFCTTSNNEPAPTEPLGKKCFVLVDCTKGTVVGAPPCTPSGGKEGAGLTPEEEESLNKKPSKKMQKKYPERKKKATVSSLPEEQFQPGKLLAASLQDQDGVAQQRAMC